MTRSRKRRVYVASKSSRAAEWRALRSAGLPITSSWIDWPLKRPDLREPSPTEWREHWDNCIKEASAADITLMVAYPGETHRGAILEIGGALSAGKKVYLVSTSEWTFRHHPNVKSFPNLEAAISAIVAPST
jgi:hypothetical protein